MFKATRVAQKVQHGVFHPSRTKSEDQKQYFRRKSASDGIVIGFLRYLSVAENGVLERSISLGRSYTTESLWKIRTILENRVRHLRTEPDVLQSSDEEDDGLS